MTRPHDRPDALELIEAVSDFLQQDVMGAVSGQLAFHVRVAANALRISARELRGALTHQGDHAARLSRFGCADDHALAAAIRSGALDDRYDELASEMRQMVWDKIQVVNPRYVTPYTTAQARDEEDDLLQS